MTTELEQTRARLDHDHPLYKWIVLSNTTLGILLAAINASLGDAAQNHDAVGYIRLNLEFHRTLYLRAQAPAMLAVLETIWLQLGPTMRAVYQRMRRNEPPRHHRLILAALRAGDEPGLRLAVRADVTQGLRHLMSQDAR